MLTNVNFTFYLNITCASRWCLCLRAVFHLLLPLLFVFSTHASSSCISTSSESSDPKGVMLHLRILLSSYFAIRRTVFFCPLYFSLPFHPPVIRFKLKLFGWWWYCMLTWCRKKLQALHSLQWKVSIFARCSVDDWTSAWSSSDCVCALACRRAH